MSYVRDALDEFVDSTWSSIEEWMADFGSMLLEPAFKIMLGTPAPRTDGQWVFGDAINTPWDSWIPDVYMAYIIPLTFALLLLGAAYVAMASPIMGEYRRKKVFQRLGITFLSMFLWIYIGTAALQFFDALAMSIAPAPSEVVNTFENLVRTAVSGTVLTVVMLVVQNVLILFALVVYGIRWVLLYTLTIGMPLLFVFWSLNTGPMKHFSSLATGLMSFYPGLLIATLPAAIMFRMAYETQLTFGLGGLGGLFISLMFIPTATVLTVYLIKRSQSAVEQAAVRTSHVSASSGGYTQTKVVQGGRDVHRGYHGSGSAQQNASVSHSVGRTVGYHTPNVSDVKSNAQNVARQTFNKVSRW